MANKKILLSLQFLRVLAFVEVFLYHSWQNYFDKIPLWCSGPLGVSLFFILSGFLMYYNYNNIEFDLSIKSCITFAIKKIKKLYLLYIITLLLGFIYKTFLISAFSYTLLYKNILYFIIDSLFIQSLIPNPEVYYSNNALAWYMSTQFILYIIFPYILYFIKKPQNKNMIKSIIFTIIIQFILSIFYCNFIIKFSNYSNIEWFCYIFPLMRLGDFLVGCFICVMFLSEKNNYTLKKSTVLEFIFLLILLISPFLIKFIYPGLYIVRYVQLYLIPSIFIVYLFAQNNGYFSKVLTNEFILYLAKISGCFYLIHELVLRYVKLYVDIYKYNIVIYMIISFVISLLLVELYNVVCKYLVKIGKQDV